MHEFPLTVHWSGSTATEYSRNAVVESAGKHPLAVSSAPSYAGDASRWNPEDMLGSALATCHMLTFFALAKKAGIDVIAYRDNAVAVLDTVERITKITEVRLTPTITVRGDADVAKVVELFEKAHKYCFVANSVTCAVKMSPTVVQS